MDEKKTGYTLLGLGLAVMVVAVIVIILTFTGQMEPIPVFNIKPPTLNTADFMPTILGMTPKGKEIPLIQTTAFNKMLNLAVLFIFMSFISSFGFKLADLGIRLIRPIRVK